MDKIILYDAILREGAQAKGISFSIEDKLKIVKALDELGIDYIEAGNPGSNPKDLEFFKRVKQMNLKHSKLIAFGSTRKVGVKPEQDNNIQSLVKADTGAVALFGKSWSLHVHDVLQTTLEENLKMIFDTVKYFKELGKEVVFDAEHFYDGYKEDPDYALKSLRAAADAGADCLTLCDTNGGTMPLQLHEITKSIVEEFHTMIGVHCHNDSGMAMANSIIGIQAGARQVQGTFNAYGERSGNANMPVLIANLQLKLGYDCISEASLNNLTTISRYISEVANVIHDERMPYFGECAFTHKGGMHIDGVTKNPRSFEHVDPSMVGNERKILMSEVAGRATILEKIQKIDPDIGKKSVETKTIIDKLKELEFKGYQFEGAESSFELVIRRILGKYKSYFELLNFKVIISHPSDNDTHDYDMHTQAIIKIKVEDREEITAAEGDGPVNALDRALRKALEVFYPELKKVKLKDFKVRVIDSESATAAKVRVLIESTDGRNSWSTIGVSTDIVEASWLALVDSMMYKLINEEENKSKRALNDDKNLID